MKKVIAIGGSLNRNSINRVFARYVAEQVQGVEIEVVDLNDFELPLYSPHLEAEQGIPANAVAFDRLLASADGIVLSMAEYNGLHTAAFKNLWDWTSRIDVHVWKSKPMLLMATSPGGRGGANVLKVTKDLMPYFGGNVVAEFSLPSFHKNFKEGELIQPELRQSLTLQVNRFQAAIDQQ